MTAGNENSSALATWSLKDVVETTPSSMAMFDTEMRYIAVSERYLQDNNIRGETSRSIVGRSVFDFRRDSENAREINRRALSGETITKDDFCFRNPDGSVLWMRYQMQPWRFPDASIGGVLLFMEIIQARKEAEEKLAPANRCCASARKQAISGATIGTLEVVTITGLTSSAGYTASNRRAESRSR